MTEITQRLSTALVDRYTIERELGAGGMATVYLAEDLKHKRKVAIKVLRPELAAVIGAERFLKEIEVTANLQHAHILPLYDSGEADTLLYYVMPFVEGESLRDRLDREKQLAVRDAVQLAAEVADALHYAHERGVVHRDIKPENILLQNGRPLVADFGIALAVQQAGGSRLTETGLSLGTPHYMSPEQATGERDLDARSDIYALAAMLHEMLAGEPPFTGPTTQAIISKVVTEEPTPLGEVRKTVPEQVEAAVLTALEKLAADRFATAAEFAAALQDRDGRTGSRRRSAVRTSSRANVLWPAAFTVAVALALYGWLRPGPEAALQQPSHLAIPIPNYGGAGTALERQLALTPDGSTLLYTAIADDGNNRTMMRQLHDVESSVLPGVDPLVAGYVVSTDGEEFIGSIEGRENLRYSINGRTSSPLPADLPVGSVFAWASDGTIWFNSATDSRGVGRIDADNNIAYPFGGSTFGLSLLQVLPGDHKALVVLAPQGTSAGPVALFDLETGSTTTLLDLAVVEARYTAGYLVYVLQAGVMEAVEFDPGTEVLGTRPVVIADGVSLTGSGVAQFTVAETGTVAYVPEDPRLLVLIDRSGRRRVATTEQRNFHAPAFSADGLRIATDFTTSDGRDVWILTISDGLLSRGTFTRDGHDATWAPDGQLTFASTADSPNRDLGIYRGRVGNPEVDSLFMSAQLGFTGTWLSDGSALVTAANSLEAGSGGDIAILRNEGRGPIEPLIVTRFEEAFPAVSPDDRWLAFVSNQSGRNEVYVRPLDGGDQVQVSLAGGLEPVWAPDGRELFYRTGATATSELLAATVETDPTFAVASRRSLFSVGNIATATPHANYHVSPDGQTFVMVQFNPSSRIMVIQNLPALVEKLRGREQ
jgi:eukaryotic-like serine/threonine-protein kinase